MINYTNAEIALNKHLQTLAGGRDIVSPGKSYEPDPETDYLRAKVMPGGTSITLDPGGKENANGIYQIGVYTPLSKVADDFNYCRTLSDTIKAGWPKGLAANIQHGGQKVIINQVDASSIMNDETHQARFLSVYFRVIAV